MKTEKEFYSFRLTLLLYSIVFIIPLTFYFIHSSFSTVDEDTRVIHQAGWLEGTTATLSIIPSPQNSQQVVKQADEAFQHISLWVEHNSDSEFYIGGETLSKNFSDTLTQWNLYKETLSHHTENTKIALKCKDSVRNLTVIIENMVYLKQNKLINMFYWNLAIAMILSLLMIYMVRAYIHKQMKKHAIHDHETNLFNKKYFLAQLETSCARAIRHNYPMSLLSIAVDDFEEEGEKYDQKTKAHILEVIGGLLTSVTRTSDTTSRYDKNHFLILLPDTEEENALILEERIRKTLETHNFMVNFQLRFKFSTTGFDNKETPAECIKRAKTLLNNLS